MLTHKAYFPTTYIYSPTLKDNSEDGNCNIWRNFKNPSTFYAATRDNPSSTTALAVSKETQNVINTKTN